MKPYIAPDAEICIFDAEDIITTSAANTLRTLGVTIDEVSYSELKDDLSEIDVLK